MARLSNFMILQQPRERQLLWRRGGGGEAKVTLDSSRTEPNKHFKYLNVLFLLLQGLLV